MAPNKLATLIVATAVCLFSYVSPIFAQTWHASRPIRVIVPFAPGGSNDFIARLLAPRLQSVLGQPVVVENKSGAGGAIGAQAVAHADPDGHTILFHSSTLVIQPLLMTTGYDALKDFTPVSLISEAPLV